MPDKPPVKILQHFKVDEHERAVGNWKEFGYRVAGFAIRTTKNQSREFFTMMERVDPND